MVDSNDEIKVVHLDLPAKDDDIARLELGSAVYLSGVVYTASTSTARLRPRPTAAAATTWER